MWHCKGKPSACMRSRTRQRNLLFCAGLAQAGSRQSKQVLCWWEMGVVCERRYLVGEQWYNLRPDALADYRVGRQHLRVWLEWDRGTMHVRDLTIKFSSYAHYMSSREWARECSLLPVLVCIASDIAQERRMVRVAQAKLSSQRGQTRQEQMRPRTVASISNRGS
jgi:Replication-relaxation